LRIVEEWEKEGDYSPLSPVFFTEKDNQPDNDQADINQHDHPDISA